ncbi:MAG: hypothetical protein ACP5NV_06715 [Candidatus Woesearchaeota archaeon]
MRKAQVTLFVILGIVILVIAGFFIYLNYSKQGIVSPTRTEVSEDLKPIQQYVEGCMNSLARDAIIQLGMRGGYIDPEDEYLSGRIFLGGPLEKDSDLAYISSEKKDAVAYWLYSYSYLGCDDCLIMSQTPYIEDIERQIAIYVSENIDLCLQDFEPFNNSGYVLEHDESMYVRATLRDEDVIIESLYSINITRGTSKSGMEQFYTEVNIPLAKYYLMALNIAALEYERGFLENLDIALISSYSGLDSKSLPPLYAYSNNYNLVYWTISDTKNKYAQILQSYTPFMQVKGSRNYNEITSQDLSLTEQNFIKFLELDLFEESDISKTEISILYPNNVEELFMEVTPNRNGLLGPSIDESPAAEYTILPPSQINSYNFFYDISYPVFFEIKDEYEPGEYYTFIFALEPTIKQNLKIKDWLNSSNRPIYFDETYVKRTFNDVMIGQKLKNPESGKEYPYVQRPEESLFCDETQRISEVYVKTYDSITHEPIDAAILYGCGNYATCNVGRTEYDSLNSYYSALVKVPLCMNGFVSVESQNYQRKNIKIDIREKKSVNLGAIYLDPIMTLNFSVTKHVVSRKTMNVAGNDITLGFLLDGTAPLGANDTVIVTFTKIDSGIDEEYSTTVMYKGNLSEIKLIPGRYVIDAQLIDDSGFVIPKECKEVCVDTEPLNPFGGEECQRIPEQSIEVKPSIWGGVQFRNESAIYISKSDILKNEIEINILRMPNPRCLDDMQEIGMIEQLSSQYRTILEPVFK